MMEIEDQPHGPWLKNGNPVCNLHALPRCGAKTRNGGQCRRIGNLSNGRCRLHGGNSPGAPRGNTNALKHGFYSQEAIEQRKYIRELLRESRLFLKGLK